MRDRLSSLRSLSGVNGHQGVLDYEDSLSDSLSQLEVEDEVGSAEERISSGGEVEEVLEEAQEVRREIQLLRLDVKRLREQNSHLLTGSCISSSSEEVRQDANIIAGDIKGRGQSTLAQLRKMDAHARELEAKHGVNSAVVRIARTQYACLSNGFRDAMTDYNEAEMSHRNACSAHIRRQMEIVGRQVTAEELDEMLEEGRWNVFADNVQSEGKTARTALTQIEQRHQELLDLEKRIRGVHEVFLDVALLVEEQGSMANAIQTTVQQTEVATADAVAKIETAKRHDRNNPFKKLLFWRR